MRIIISDLHRPLSILAEQDIISAMAEFISAQIEAEKDSQKGPRDRWGGHLKSGRKSGKSRKAG